MLIPYSLLHPHLINSSLILLRQIFHEIFQFILFPFIFIHEKFLMKNCRHFLPLLLLFLYHSSAWSIAIPPPVSSPVKHGITFPPPASNKLKEFPRNCRLRIDSFSHPFAYFMCWLSLTDTGKKKEL